MLVSSRSSILGVPLAPPVLSARNCRRPASVTAFVTDASPLRPESPLPSWYDHLSFEARPLRPRLRPQNGGHGGRRPPPPPPTGPPGGRPPPPSGPPGGGAPQPGADASLPRLDLRQMALAAVGLGTLAGLATLGTHPRARLAASSGVAAISLAWHAVHGPLPTGNVRAGLQATLPPLGWAVLHAHSTASPLAWVVLHGLGAAHVAIAAGMLGTILSVAGHQLLQHALGRQHAGLELPQAACGLAAVISSVLGTLAWNGLMAA